MADPVKVVVPAIGVSLNIPVGEGPKTIGLVFQTHIPGDLPDAEVNERLDKFMEHGRRQQIIGKIPDLKKEVEKFEFNIRNIEEDIAKLDKQNAEKYEERGRVGAVKLNATDKAARENALVNLNRYNEMLAKIKTELAEAENLKKLDKAEKKAAKAA